MSNDSKKEAFESRVKRLRSLRAKLCDQKTEWKSAFEIRDFVISELQEMHQELSTANSETTTAWCKDRVEHILQRMCALPPEDNGETDA